MALGASGDKDFQQWLPWAGLPLSEVEAVQLVLRGDSCIDWHRLNFTRREEVDNFLRVHQFDPTSQEDRHRMRVLVQTSVQYLTNHFNLKVPEDLVEGDMYDLFLQASFPERRFNRRKLLSCMILKVVSIVHHLEGRALLHRTSMSDADMFRLVQGRIEQLRTLAQRMRTPVLDIYGNSKSQDSLIGKLLSKRDTFAATVFDKLRYRVVVRSREDILPTLAWLMRNLMPFNYVLPGKSFNSVVDPRPQLDALTDLLPFKDGILSNYQPDEDTGFSTTTDNEFSGSTYRMLNFIVDLPVRLDNFITRELALQHGRIGFALVEFQMVDAVSEAENEEGENSHSAYKERQKVRVIERLRWGGILKAHRASRRMSQFTRRGEGDEEEGNDVS